MRRSSSVKEDRRRPRFSSFAARLMPPAAGLRPNLTPLRDQGKDTRGGDLLAARHEGNQTGRRVARRESVPCHPPPAPAGTSPRREEITTQPGACEEGHQGAARAESVPKFGTITSGEAGTRSSAAGRSRRRASPYKGPSVGSNPTGGTAMPTPPHGSDQRQCALDDIVRRSWRARVCPAATRKSPGGSTEPRGQVVVQQQPHADGRSRGQVG